MTAAPALPTAAAPAWSVAWAEALADLEMSVSEAEGLLRAAHAPDVPGASAVIAAGLAAGSWTPPSHLGMLPAPLLERAAALLDRQLAVARQLAEAASHSRRQLRAVESIRATPEAQPVYLDTAG